MTYYKFLGRDHLQKLYSTFLGVRGGSAEIRVSAASTERSIWRAIEDAIRANSTADGVTDKRLEVD